MAISAQYNKGQIQKMEKNLNSNVPAHSFLHIPYFNLRKLNLKKKMELEAANFGETA